MNQKVILLSLFIFLLFISSSCSRHRDFTKLKGPYLGQKPPGMTPEIFAPGIISKGYSEYAIAFTPDGKELYLWLGENRPCCVILWMKEEYDRWSPLEVCPFSGRYVDMKFSISPDGNKFLFSSNRPRKVNGKPLDNLNIWYMKRIQNRWSEPRCYGPTINTNYHDYYPSMARNGNLYFFSDRDGGRGEDDIYYSRFTNGKMTNAKNIGPSINTGLNEGDPFIAPDESFIIFCSRDCKGGFGNNDLYISFRKNDGSWTVAKNMGARINTVAEEVCPIVTHDDKYLFFSSNRKIDKSYPEIPLTYKQIVKVLEGPGNGKNDIFWVDAKIIEDLKPKNLK